MRNTLDPLVSLDAPRSSLDGPTPLVPADTATDDAAQRFQALLQQEQAPLDGAAAPAPMASAVGEAPVADAAAAPADSVDPGDTASASLAQETGGAAPGSMQSPMDAMALAQRRLHRQAQERQATADRLEQRQLTANGMPLDPPGPQPAGDAAPVPQSEGLLAQATPSPAGTVDGSTLPAASTPGAGGGPVVDMTGTPLSGVVGAWGGPTSQDGQPVPTGSMPLPAGAEPTQQELRRDFVQARREQRAEESITQQAAQVERLAQANTPESMPLQLLESI
jgi:hypothetical protein